MPQQGLATMTADEGNGFSIDNLTRHDQQHGVIHWHVDYRGMRLELTTTELLSPGRIQRAVAKQFGRVIMLGKKADWHVRLKKLMETCNIVKDPETWDELRRRVAQAKAGK
jgi:Uri superfamily endonuclease